MNDRLINHYSSDAEIAQAERLSAKRRIAESLAALKRAFPLHEEIVGRIAAVTSREHFANRVNMFKAALPVEVTTTPAAVAQPSREPISETAKLDAEYTFEPTDQPGTELDTDRIRTQIESIESLTNPNFTVDA